MISISVKANLTENLGTLCCIDKDATMDDVRSKIQLDLGLDILVTGLVRLMPDGKQKHSIVRNPEFLTEVDFYLAVLDTSKHQEEGEESSNYYFNDPEIHSKQQQQQQQPRPYNSHDRPPLRPNNNSNNDGPATITLQSLQDAIDEIKSSQRATPQYSASYFGDRAIKQLKKLGCFATFPCSSLPQSTFDEDIETEQDHRHLKRRSVLTLEQQKHLVECETEHQVVAFVTPYLEEIVAEHEYYVVVNSEEYKWLEMSDNAPSEYKNKPDLFVGHEAIVTYRPPFQHRDAKLTSMRRQTEKFGVLSHWKLRSCIGMICEAKQTINNQAFGQIINYGSHICRHGCRVGDDDPETTRLMLFDKEEFWLISVTRGFPSFVTTCQWTTPGSFDLIRNFVMKPNLISVLDQACQHFQVRVVTDNNNDELKATENGSGAFLGAGTFGFVFRVKRLNEEKSKCLALKVCISGRTGSFDNVRRLDHEFVRMRQAHEACPNVVMGIEEGGFQQLVDKNNEEVGAALLMSHVGRNYSDLSPKNIVDSLKELHSKGILHGDARLANIVSVNGNPVWIDFCESAVATLPIFFEQELEQLEEEMRQIYDAKFIP
jgi:hypothetical protein